MPNAQPSDLPQATPAVSVVVPCYNAGGFLDGLLVSLARQTFRDFEVVIVDDGSTDPDTRHKLASLGDRARVVHQENGGLPAARNTGIAAARAALVMPLDCDDTIAPPFLEEAVALLRSSPPDVAAVFSHKRLVGEAHGLLERHFNCFDLLFTNPMPAGLLMRKAVWQAAGGYDEAMRDGYEDWEFYLRLMRMGYRAAVIPKPYFEYNVSRGGMLFKRSSDKHAALWRSIRRKHAAAYRPMAMLRFWWRSRDGTGRVSLLKALAAYMLAAILPDTWFSRLVVGQRRRQLLEGHLRPYHAVQPNSNYAA